MHERLNTILKSLLTGVLEYLTPDNIVFVSNSAMVLLEKPQLDEYDVMCANQIIMISQIVYNNTDRAVLFLDDGVYDLLLEKYKRYDPKFQVGAPVIQFDQSGEIVSEKEYIEPMSFIDDPEKFIDNSLYFENLTRYPHELYQVNCMEMNRTEGSSAPMAKRNVKVPHMYPKLVGSLDKCKFTMNSEAMARDVFNDPNVTIFERDFLGKHLQMGLIDMTTPFELVAELKYDGVSVEADVTNKILSARSRGDANEDIAADMTDIFKGYTFPMAADIDEKEAFGMKFEAVISYLNLDKLSQLRGKAYKNSRNGVIGLLGASDAYNFRHLVTLVPLATSIEGLDRVTEIEFLNKYYNTGEYLRYSILRGTYIEVLYQVSRFVQEAEALRNMLPFMYDGVVISYRDKRIIEALGRENSINKYSIAIKFNPLVREAIFNGYTYTVGQDGRVTPMIHYTPVEFYGTIHTKSSGHSYKRFHDLGLAIGDIIRVEYMNDVMPYVTKPEVNHNLNNPNPPELFPEICPFCGERIIVSETGKTAMCPNKKCPERNIAKMANMMSKLNLKDFGEETFRFLGTTSLYQLMHYTYDDVKELGPNTAVKLLDRIKEIKTAPIYDYKIMGAIGFTGIATETWKKILNEIRFVCIVMDEDDELYNKLHSIKGIGPATASTIVSERKDLAYDLTAIMELENLILSYGMKSGKTIRFTGCRPSDDLYAYLTNCGCDARPDAGVTKTTDILVVPYNGFTSSKTNKIGDMTIVVDMPEFMANTDKYIH